jgi:hypothetical protein
MTIIWIFVCTMQIHNTHQSNHTKIQRGGKFNLFGNVKLNQLGTNKSVNGLCLITNFFRLHYIYIILIF